MKIILWHKRFSLINTCLWSGIGTITIGSIIQSSLSWHINLLMGLLFFSIGCFFYLRSSNLHHFYFSGDSKIQKNLHLQRFLRLDMIFVLGSCLVGGILLFASISRVFKEGFAIFG